MGALSQGQAPWFASRATGVVSLVLLTLVVLLGILVNRQVRLPGLPAFATTSLHRSLSLMALAFVAVHVATVVADRYVNVSALAVLVPFTSAYRPFWLGLGAVALDFMLVLIITSLARARMSRRAWRGIHWLAYAAWPVAFVHGIGAGTDLRGGGLAWLAIACGAVVGAAVVWRAAHAVGEVPRTERAADVFARGPRPGSSGKDHHHFGGQAGSTR